MRLRTGAVLVAVVTALASCSSSRPVTPRTTTITVPAPTPAPTSSTAATTTSPAPTTSPHAPQDAPKTYADALAHFAGGQVSPDVKSPFVSPSGNIYCDIGALSPVVGCELKEGRIRAPSADLCGSGAAAKDVGRVELTPTGPRPVCNSDTMTTPGAPVLPYGAISTSEGSPLTCLSESIGMTCLDTGLKKGFFIARESYRTF